MRTINVVLFWFLTSQVFCQTISKIEFVEYDKVISELKLGKVSPEMNYDDYESILLLDTLNIALISKVDSNIVKKFRRVFRNPLPTSSIKYFEITSKSIKDYFLNPELAKNFTGTGNFGKKVFVWNNKAIFWVDNKQYRLTSLQNKTKVELIATMED